MVVGVVNQFRKGVKNIFDKAKETIIYQSITRDKDADDNPVEYINQTEIDAVVQIMRLEDIQEMGGLLQVGDAIAFFDHNANIVKEDRIIHRGIYYRITEAFPETVAGNVIFIQAFCKREDYRPTGHTNYIKTLTETFSLSDVITKT